MIKGYYFITDAGLSKNGNLSDVRNAVEAGVNIVQYRSSIGDPDAMLGEAKELRKVCKGRPLFIVNDMVSVAIAIDADGVHIGQGDMSYEEARGLLGKNKIIGVTVHDIKEAIAAEKKGADYLGVSPIFLTGTKEDAGKPCGTELIIEVKKNCNIPIVAIGGIDLDNAKQVIVAGADALCAISAVVTKDDVKGEIGKFQGLFEQKRKGATCFMK